MNITPCKKYAAFLTAKVFGDLRAAEEPRLQTHLAECGACRNFLVEMEHVLGKIGAPQHPEMSGHFWESYWHRLVQRLEKAERGVLVDKSVFGRVWEWLREKWPDPPLFVPLVRKAGILGLLICGVVIGRYWWPQDGSREPQISQLTPPAISVTQGRAEQWLERSQILLIGMVNEDLPGAAKPDFSHQRLVSRTLLTEARALNRELDPAADRQMLQLMTQLELILLQIANLEAEHDLAAVELVRDGIAHDGLLLKINIAELTQQNMSLKKSKQKSPEIL